ncbi:hypothetical protein [Reyranella sp.]|uniref:hypothetical protein n=1 Tax=Reyranella sp. TaxID=1929291 RepID=UPI0037846DE3
MSTKSDITLDEFRAWAGVVGLSLTEDDIIELHKGYLGMMQLAARVPQEWAWEAESAHVFAPLPGARR